MNRQPLRKLIHRYKERYPEENGKIQNVLHFLDENKNCFDRHNWAGHFTGSAWVVDRERSSILMTHHRKLDMWLQLGGHADGHPDLKDVALTEAKEESGLKRFTLLSEDIFDLDVHPIPPHGTDPPHFHYDIRFIIETDHGPEDIVISDESHDVAWIRYENILKRNPEASMERMLKKTKLQTWV